MDELLKDCEIITMRYNQYGTITCRQHFKDGTTITTRYNSYQELIDDIVEVHKACEDLKEHHDI